MGYTTDFLGEFKLNKPLLPEHRMYLQRFRATRRVKRNEESTATRSDPCRAAVGLPVGRDGEYFVGEQGFMGQDHGPGIVDFNSPPADQPGLWCQWVSNEDGTAIVWDEGEKFYDYVEWIEYLIAHFLEPWGYTLNGEISWQGESSNDRGIIYVKENQVQAVEDVIVSPAPKWS